MFVCFKELKKEKLVFRHLLPTFELNINNIVDSNENKPKTDLFEIINLKQQIQNKLYKRSAEDDRYVGLPSPNKKRKT